jgi:flagella basal body P-ring formation protein FlgA
MIALIALLASAAIPCHPVDSDRISAANLTLVDPRFASLPADASAGYAPAPGVRRVIAASELERIAAKYGLTAGGFTSVCFEWPLHSLTQDDVLAAIRKSLATPDARIELTEFSRYSVPAGELVFPRSGLTKSAKAEGAWRGYVEYEPKRRFAIWARLKIAVPLTRVIAVADLRVGSTIEGSQVKVETVEGFPEPEPVVQSLEEAVGRVLKRPVGAGMPVPAAALDTPKTAQSISRGETVQVDVHSGAARLKLEGRAESDGRDGQQIRVRNTVSGKTFLATVAGKGKVLVEKSVD